MILGPEVKVGLIVFIAIVALIAAYMFVGGRAYRAGNYDVYAMFDNAQRLNLGTEVRMAGVKIGFVRDISLTKENLAQVVMTISRRMRIPRGSKVQITSGTLIGDPYVEIIPGPADTPPVKPGALIPTQVQARFEDLMPKLDNLVTRLQGTVGSVNKILGNEQMVANISKALANLEVATREAAVWMSEMRDMAKDNRAQVEQALASLSNAAKELQSLVEDMHSLAAGPAKTEIETVLANVKRASADFETAMKNIRDVTSELKKQDVQAILTNVQSASANLDEASQAIAKIVTDGRLAEDLRATISNAREATEQTKELATRLNRKIGGSKTPVEKPKPVRSGLRADVLERFRTSDVRVDVNWTIPWRDRTFYQIGARDIGESAGLNLQAGRMLNACSDFRYGIHGSKVGIGYDRRIGERTSFGLDLYRPNDPDMEFALTHRFGKDWEIAVGMDRVFDDASFLLGLSFKK